MVCHEQFAITIFFLFLDLSEIKINTETTFDIDISREEFLENSTEWQKEFTSSVMMRSGSWWNCSIFYRTSLCFDTSFSFFFFNLVKKVLQRRKRAWIDWHNYLINSVGCLRFHTCAFHTFVFTYNTAKLLHVYYSQLMPLIGGQKGGAVHIEALIVNYEIIRSK